MTGKRTRRSRSKDEPELELDASEWVEFGGELYWAVDETAGGAPVGLTLSEYRQIVEDVSGGEGWHVAKRLLRSAMTSRGRHEPEIGRVVHLGDGLSRDAFAAEVEDGAGSKSLVVLLPRERDPERDCRTRDEASLLARLAPLAKQFRTPRPVAVLPSPLGMALVLEHVHGIPVDLRAGRMQGVRPWALVGELAAAVHAIPLEALGEISGHATRRDHGEAALSALAGLEHDQDPCVRSALEWLGENLPPVEPSTLVHGDLLGQNILLPLPWESDSKPALIDWEYARRGDPAHDLAIVTRGVRRPFQVEGGFDRLLDAYREASRRDIHPHEVRFHELCLLLGLYRDPRNAPVRAQHLHQIEIMLEHLRRGRAREE